jgi:hypothetical protein
MVEAGTSEEEAAEKIHKAQTTRAVYAARIQNRELAVGTVFGLSVAAVKSASSELIGLTDRELKRRQTIIESRLCEVLQAPEDSRPYLAEILDLSGPCIAMRELQPSPYVDFNNRENVAHTAKSILEKCKKLALEWGKAI